MANVEVADPHAPSVATERHRSRRAAQAFGAGRPPAPDRGDLGGAPGRADRARAGQRLLPLRPRLADHGRRRDRVLHVPLDRDVRGRDRHRPQRAPAAGAAPELRAAADPAPAGGGRPRRHGDLPRRPSALRDRAHVLRDGRRLARPRHLHGLARGGHPARDRPDARRARREAVARDEPRGPPDRRRGRRRRRGGLVAPDAGLRPDRQGQHPRAPGRGDRHLPRDRRADRLLLRRRRAGLPAVLDQAAADGDRRADGRGHVEPDPPVGAGLRAARLHPRRHRHGQGDRGLPRLAASATCAPACPT